MDEKTLIDHRDDGSSILVLAGRTWPVNHLEWMRRRTHVEPAKDAGRSRWRGGGRLLGYKLCLSIRKILADDSVRPGWSRRTVTRLEVFRAQFPQLASDEADVC